MEFSFKKDFLLGAATAATQIEGGDILHSWSDWARRGHIKDGSSPDRANDHLNRWKSDLDLMRSLGLEVYRLGIEWARIEPEEGAFDNAALDYYTGILEYLGELGIRPLVTLHHFTNPMWFEEKGAFTKPENMRYFLSFVERVVSAFGPLANEYITINEPNVYATGSYFFGEWPPGEKSLGAAVTVMSVMAACHVKAYSLIHARRSEMGFEDTRVGFAHHMRVFEPKSRLNPWHALCTGLIKRFFQTSVSRAFYLGDFSFPLKMPCPVEKGEYSDFLALNYYSRSTVSGFGDGVKEDTPKNDLGWEIYPQGIAQCAEEMYGVLKRPIYITENGTCDNSDSFRCRYLCDHLKVVAESDLPFERYYHWCFCDNFEWVEGESARFGLVHVDYETQTRTVKKSGRFFTQIIANKGVTEELYKEFAASETYHM